MKRKFEKSFYDWCVENNHKDWLELWDDELNDCSPKEVSRGTNKKYWFKCSKGLHKSELKTISNLTNKYRANILQCNQCSFISLYDWCIENNRQDILELWDYELNGCNPKEIPYGTGTKYYFKCPRNIHKSELKRLDNLASGNSPLKCNQCNSFGQWLVDTYGEDALEIYWDYKKNKINPFSVSRCSAKKLWIFCQEKPHHESYEISCANFYNGYRCYYCRGQHKIHPKDSFAQYHIDNTDKDFIEKYWSDKNTIDPFTLAPRSKTKIWIKCQNGHEDYMVDCDSFTGKETRCQICSESHGERKIRKYLNERNIKYIYEKTLPNLVGVGNRNLSYDFYLLEYNLLIEYQGKQHYESAKFFGGKRKLIEQQEHDKRKKEYAKIHNINLLEIPYWDFDNIEEILNKNIK